VEGVFVFLTGTCFLPFLPSLSLFYNLHRRENRYKTKSRWRRKGRLIGEKKLQGEGDVIRNQTDRCKGDEGGARQKKGIRDGEEKVAEGGERIGT